MRNSRQTAPAVTIAILCRLCLLYISVLCTKPQVSHPGDFGKVFYGKGLPEADRVRCAQLAKQLLPSFTTRQGKAAWKVSMWL